MSKDLFKAFGINDFPKLLQDNMGGKQAFVAATLGVQTVGTRGSITEGTKPTFVSKTCRGFIDFQRVADQTGTLVRAGTKIIVLLGNSIQDLAVPKPGDRITIEGKTYIIADDTEIDRDPASATYACEVREL